MAVGDNAAPRRRAPRGIGLATLRVGGFRASIDLLRDLGHDPEPVVRACGLTLDLFRDPENEAPLAAALQLLRTCAKISGLPHFGLLAGARNGLSTLGLFGHLAQTAPDVGSAIEDLISASSTYTTGLPARN